MDDLKSDEILAIFREALRPLAEGILIITEEIKKAHESAEASENMLLLLETPSTSIH